MAQLLLMYTYKCTSHLKAGTTREKQTLQVTNLSQSIVSFFFFFHSQYCAAMVSALGDTDLYLAYWMSVCWLRWPRDGLG